MVIFRYIKDIENQLKEIKKAGLKIAFVPTMGALHSGHISLINQAKNKADVTICSIFVNPTQFNDKADFEKYPNTIDADIAQLLDARCDILFLPNVKEMYPDGFGNTRPVLFGYLAETLEGEHRPGHFNGMAQIVEKLLRITRPDLLLMGQKDYQQQLIVGELIKKRGFKTQLITAPTVRESDGLAKSSRNVRLDEKSRQLAAQISAVLKHIKYKVSSLQPKQGEARRQLLDEIKEKAYWKLKNVPGMEVEYLEIRNAKTLAPPANKKEKLVALAAVRLGGVRLIDNMLL